MGEEESTNNKEEKRRYQMEGKINSIDARILGMMDNISSISHSIAMNRLMLIFLLVMTLVMFFCSK
ncbi:MAG: hypothetical protein MASP_00515 [Candidatus Methanolliviera sp. GoM_asphalt]|nr:MAG: hypothetical protein MASP_00515 [Candidatus Methanolliviera sp. GoM_asphalt]